MKKIYARKCEVKTISKDLGSVFIEENHTQKASKASASVYIGIFFQDNLLGVCMFSNPRTTKKKKEYSRELLRLCFKKDTQVIGGASKLIKYYIKNYNPVDFFTYQDTTGENSDVYERSGMKMVKDGIKTKKQYMVAPGKNMSTANRKEALSMAYAVKYGPDRILGTKIGEVFEENGKRKSNRNIFIEELGWHIEETTGDSIYEWTNPNISFYVYKITSKLDNGYYIGRRKINIKNATIQECINDKYMGSGGVKFKNWINNIGKENLEKEIMWIVNTKKEAIAKEEKEIGDLYKTDVNCKNSHKGGLGKNASNWSDLFTTGNCSVHGETKFFASYCCACRNQKTVTIKMCDIHGETKHQGGSCSKCSSEKTFHIKKCIIHGDTMFAGNECRKCSIDKSWSIMFCDIHGETKHQSGKCKKCSIGKNINIKFCDIHGETTFYGESCRKCQVDKSLNDKICAIHGKTKHRGNQCCKCASKEKDAIKFCKIHGETKFQYSKCILCIKDKRDSLKECPTHGLVKHRGENCYTCTIEKANAIKFCDIHGETKFRGNNCCKCSSEKAAHKRFHVKLNTKKKDCRFCLNYEK